MTVQALPTVVEPRAVPCRSIRTAVSSVEDWAARNHHLATSATTGTGVGGVFAAVGAASYEVGFGAALAAIAAHILYAVCTGTVFFDDAG